MRPEGSSQPPAAAARARRGIGLAHALRGLRGMLATQCNARIHLAATVLAIAAGLAAGLRKDEWFWIGAAVIAVWTAEAFNTAIELLGDAAAPAPNPLVGAAKDTAAGAVLVAAAGAAAAGVAIFLPRILERISPGS